MNEHRLQYWPLAMVLALMVLALMVLGGCQCGDEPDVDEHTESSAKESDEKADDHDDIERIFGLPLPADASFVLEEDNWVQVFTQTELEELEDFYKRHVVDAEVVVSENNIEIVPLRPHSSFLEGRNRGTETNPRVYINYRQPRDRSALQPLPIHETDDDGDDEPEVTRITPDSSDRANTGSAAANRAASNGRRTGGTAESPGWLDEIEGQPVEVRTDDGELLAPDAKWGEPYIPPEGSPLDKPRYRHNFGRPYGDWR